METDSYLAKLTSRLAEGLSMQTPAFRERHAAFLLSWQNRDGGFSGREGGSDLYYTAFALRGLAVLDALSDKVCDRAAAYLKECLKGQTSVVDFFSFLYACLIVQAFGGPDVLADSSPDWPERVADTLESFRTGDGGYGKTNDAKSGSTYHTFLVGLCYQILGRGFPEPDRIVQFVESRRREDGGFVEIAAMRRSGTNPTAAAVGALQLAAGDLTAIETESVVDFLVRMPSMEGGLRANDRIQIADLLSTFTGCWTLNQLGALDRIDHREVLDYAKALEQNDGGYWGALWQQGSDVEYTFYGLGTVSLFAREG